MMPVTSNNTNREALNPPFCFSNNISLITNDPVASIYFPSVFCVLGLTSNLIAFVVLIKAFRRTHSRSRSSFLLFLCGLVVTDFMGLLVTGVIVISTRIIDIGWQGLDPHCHLCNFMGMSMVFYGLCPLLLGATMAVERFIGITRPFTRSTNKSNSRVYTTVASVWITAGAIGLLPFFGLGRYHLQTPGSWCFLNISPEPLDMAFCLVFSLVGLTCLAVSFILNTVSVVTLLRVCCGQNSHQRRRDNEVEMMVQLILIMVIASICWYPLLIYILKTTLNAEDVNPESVLFFIRMATVNQIFDPWIYILCQKSRLRRVFIAQTVLSSSKPVIRSLLLFIRLVTWNQIMDPWVYILFRRSVLKRVYPRLDWSRGSFASIYSSVGTSMRRLTRSSVELSGRLSGQISPKQEDEVLSMRRFSPPPS